VKTSTWERSKQKQFDYRSRSPSGTDLYRLIYTYREEFEYRWPQLFEHKYGVLRAEVLKAFDAYLDCGILRHGCALACCEQCSHYELIAFSCKARAVCSSCGAKRACIFAENLHDNILLEQDHAHQVFSIPKRLRIYFRFSRKRHKYLFWAAWHAYKTYVARRLPQCRTASVMSLHCAGELLEFNPHLHCCTLLGGIDEHGVFHRLSDIDTAELEELFSEKLFSYLLDEGLITEEDVESMKSWEHSGFSVFNGNPIESDDADQRRFVGRYMMKPPISAERLSIDETGLEPTVVLEKELDDTVEQRRLSPLEFLAKLSLLVPDKWEQCTRHYGIYSCRTRGEEKKKQAQKELQEKTPAQLQENVQQETAPKPTSTWQICMKRIFEIDPLECKKCGGRMKIKSFVLNQNEIKRLTESLGLEDWRAPPPFSLAKGIQIDTSYAQ